MAAEGENGQVMMVQRRTVQRRTVKTRRVKTRRVTPPARARPRPTRPLDPPPPLRSARLPGPTPRLLGQERQPFGRARPPRPVRPLGQRSSFGPGVCLFQSLRLCLARALGSPWRQGSARRRQTRPRRRDSARRPQAALQLATGLAGGLARWPRLAELGRSPAGSAKSAPRPSRPTRPSLNRSAHRAPSVRVDPALRGSRGWRRPRGWLRPREHPPRSRLEQEPRSPRAAPPGQRRRSGRGEKPISRS